MLSAADRTTQNKEEDEEWKRGRATVARPYAQAARFLACDGLNSRHVLVANKENLT